MPRSDTRQAQSKSATPRGSSGNETRRQRVSSARRIRVTAVRPQVEGGRYALRRIVGDRLRIGADVLCDADVSVRACILYRVSGESRWRPAPMTADATGVRWTGTLRLQNGGRTQYGVEAWVDVFATWRRRLEAFLDASTDGASPQLLIEEGAVILQHAMQGAAGADLRLLAEKCEELRSAGGREELARWQRDRELHKRMLVYGERRHVVRTEPVLEVVAERKRAGFCTWCHLPGDVPVPEGTANVLRRVAVDIVHRRSATAGGAAVEVPGAAVHGSEAAVDLPLPAPLRAEWHQEHPEWFAVRVASGATSPSHAAAPFVDFWCDERHALWDACLDVALEHIRRGAQVLVAPQASSVPFAFWEWLTTRVHRQHPEVLFVSHPVLPVVAQALATCGFSQTILDWDGSLEQARQDIVERMAGADEWRATPTVPARSGAALADGRRLAWPELRLTHLLCATSSGSFGFRGVPDDAEAAPWLQSLAQWRRETHALQLVGNLGLLASSNPELFALHRLAPGGRSAVLVIVNMHATQQRQGEVELPQRLIEALASDEVELEDLVDGTHHTWSARGNFVRLGPRQAHVLRVVRRTGLLL